MVLLTSGAKESLRALAEARMFFFCGAYIIVFHASLDFEGADVKNGIASVNKHFVTKFNIR